MFPKVKEIKTKINKYAFAQQNKVKRKKKRKQWYIYAMEYYSAIKKKSFESVLMRWMKLELIIQSEVSQKEKRQYSMLLLLSHFSRV